MTIEQIVLKTEKIDCTGCRTCATDYEADNLKHALVRLNGVSTVKVNKVTGKVTIKYDTKIISASKFTDRIKKLGYHVEGESREDIQ